MQSDELICLKLYVALKTSLTKTWYKPCPILQMRTYSRQYKSSQFYLKSPESKESQLAWRSFTICPQQRCLPALPSVSKWYYSWCTTTEMWKQIETVPGQDISCNFLFLIVTLLCCHFTAQSTILQAEILSIASLRRLKWPTYPLMLVVTSSGHSDYNRIKCATQVI